MTDALDELNPGQLKYLIALVEQDDKSELHVRWLTDQESHPVLARLKNQLAEWTEGRG